MISFIIPLFNHHIQAKEMWASLLQTLPPGLVCEAILIDDGSSDGTAQWLQSLEQQSTVLSAEGGLRVHILRNAANQGFAKTNNKAIATARGEVLAMLNSDLLLSPGWLEPMLAVLQAPSLNAGLVGNIQLRVADNAIDHAGMRLGLDGKMQHMQTLTENLVPHLRVFAATGACCLVRKSDFDAVGGFDEKFVNGGEDIDLCMRLRQAGKPVCIALESRVGHHVRLSRGQGGLQDERNSRRLLTKWRPMLKREITRHWVDVLNGNGAQASINSEAPNLVGTLLPAFAATPHLAAITIAENILLHEECRWQRLLDHTNPNFGVRSLWHRISDAPEFLAELHVEGLRSARNFFVCGYKSSETNLQEIASSYVVTVTVNGIQQKTFVLDRENSFNLGLINPLVLPGIVNVFRVSMCLVNLAGDKSDACTSNPLVVTHLVLDDEEIVV